MQTKTTFPKTLLFFYLIPYLAVLLLTGLDCFVNFKYLEWYWVKEWMVILPETLAYYLLLAMIFAFFGIVAYYIFFGKTWQKWTISILSVVASFLFPCLRYIVRHIGYGDYLTDLDMLDMYNEDVTTGVSLLAYCGGALIIILLVYAFYVVILREKPRTDVSSKNPVGMTMLVFFAVIASWTTVNFFMVGDFAKENILSLLLEYVIDLAGFWVAVFAAHILAKWDTKQTEEPLTLE
jgi:hypothetical protein